MAGEDSATRPTDLGSGMLAVGILEGFCWLLTAVSPLVATLSLVRSALFFHGDVSFTGAFPANAFLG